MENIHDEWKNENSLTSPEDRDRVNKWVPNSGAIQLTNEETIFAMAELNNTAFVNKFPRNETRYSDPPIPFQNIGLISFVPAKGATPNEHGIYGFSKIRGVFNTELEANSRAEDIIRNVDSYHQIFHTYIGKPFPLTLNSNFSAETSEIDIRKRTEESINESVVKKRKDEASVISEIKKREEELIADTKKEHEEPDDRYTTLKVKKAQITWTYVETIKKIEEMKIIITRTREEIKKMDEEDSTLQNIYYEKYMKARIESGMKDESTMSNNFMKFLVDDFDIGF
jgi:hypothetical protein